MSGDRLPHRTPPPIDGPAVPPLHTPLVTVAIPVYNRRDLTLRAVESALAQDIDGLRVLAVDDGSSDGTWDALRSLSDPRLRVVQNSTNLGLFGNFNRCIELAGGEFVRVLCCDDRLTPGCLRRELEAAAANPSVVLVTTRGRMVGPGGPTLGTAARLLPPGLYRGASAIALALWVHTRYGYNPFNYPSGVLLRRDAVSRAGLFDTRMRVAGDVDLFLRVLNFGDLLVCDHVGCEITVHPGQVSSRLAAGGYELRELLHLVRAHGPRLGPVGGALASVRQTAGLALGLELLHRFRGDRPAADTHAAVVRESGVGRWPAALALANTVCLRSADRLLGFRPLPPRAINSPLGRPPGSRPRTAPR